MNLPEKLAREIARVAVIRTHAEEIGPAGNFLRAECTLALERAFAAIGSGDLLGEIRALAELEGFKE